MTKFFASLHNVLFDVRNREEGQTFAEYGLIVSLVAVALVGATIIFRDQVDAVLNAIAAAL